MKARVSIGEPQPVIDWAVARLQAAGKPVPADPKDAIPWRGRSQTPENRALKDSVDEDGNPIRVPDDTKPNQARLVIYMDEELLEMIQTIPGVMKDLYKYTRADMDKAAAKYPELFETPLGEIQGVALGMYQ